MIGSLSKSYIGLISMRCWSWPKVKVTRSKVKVIYAILWKTCFDYISWTNDWILMMLIHITSIDKMLMLTKGQGHKVKGQGHIRNFVKNLFWLYIINPGSVKGRLDRPLIFFFWRFRSLEIKIFIILVQH